MTIKNIFDHHAEEFVKAKKSRNFDVLLETFAEIMRIAKDECGRKGIDPTMSKYYSDTANDAKIALVRLLQKKVNVNSTDGLEREVRQWFSDDIPSERLNDVKGLENVKREFVVNVMAPFTEKTKPVYQKYRGEEAGLQILLYGPPGTGKTFLAKCLAGELGCHFSEVQSKDILAGIVGHAEKNVADVFEQAEKYERCIIFFDEIDAIAASRDDDESKYTKGILTTMLTKMDGFTKIGGKNKCRIIFAATNRPWILDSALRRGGRFETQIFVPPPDATARMALVEQALGKNIGAKRPNIPLDELVTIQWLSDRFDGFAGADILAACKQIINKPLMREIMSLYADNGAKYSHITQRDCEAVIKNYINVINSEMLERFKAYADGISHVENVKPHMNDALLALLEKLVDKVSG